MFTGLCHVAFRVKDLERSLDFYCGKLGFREAFRLEREDQPSPWLVYLQLAENAFVELFPVPPDELGGDDAKPSYMHYCLMVDDLPATLQELAGRGLEINSGPRSGPDISWQHWLTDPDGNEIELLQMMPVAELGPAAATAFGATCV